MNVLPRIREVMEREFHPLFMGDVVACQLASAGITTRCYFPLTRPTERHLESRREFEMGMGEIMRHAETHGVSTLASLRPPGTERIQSWKSAADYFTDDQATYFIRYVLHVGTEVSAEEWLRGAGENNDDVRRIAFLGA